LLAAAPAHANPLDAFGLGSRAAAMAGAATASPEGIAANYYNPGALAAASSMSFDIGYMLASPHMSWNGRDAGVDQTRGMFAGLNVPGRVGGLKLALGATIFLPDDRLTRVKSEPLSGPRFIYYDNRTQRLYMAANAAVGLGHGLYFGAGFVWMSSSHGNVQLNGLVGFPDPEQSDLRLAIDYQLETVRYPQMGLYWQHSDRLTFGLTYRHSFTLRLAQSLHIEGIVGPLSHPLIQNGKVDVSSQSTDLFQPAQLAAGMAFRVRPRWLVTADVVYERWSEFENPGAAIQLSADLKDFNRFVHIPNPPQPQAPYFHDVLALRSGVEYSVPRRGSRLEWQLRGGYGYEPSPVPDQFGETNFADGDKHTLGTGLGVVIRDVPLLEQPLALDAHLAWTIVPARLTRKALETDPVGDFEASGWVLATGITMRVSF